MKAIACTRYGPLDVLQLKDIAKLAPKDDEVLIKVHAASINSRNWRLMRANPFFIRLMARGFLKPQNTILRADMAGRVETVGSNVRQSQPGDEVFGCLSRYAGSTFAEHVCARENEIALWNVR
jgi:NADPH:quinone reductase-like Zn-dependent oxidoreductase